MNELIISLNDADTLILTKCGFNVATMIADQYSIDGVLEQNKESLSAYSSLIVASSNDEDGTEIDKAFVKKFGIKAKLINKSLLSGRNIYEEYYKTDQEQIKKIIETARAKIEGLRDLDKKPYQGLEAIQGNYISTGLKSIDYAFNDLQPGCVTLITGRSNDGKSTFVTQVMANAVDTGNKVLLVSGEGVQELMINNFYKTIIGRNEAYFKLIKINKRYMKEPKPEALEALKEWHRGKFKIFNKGDSELKTTEQLFELMSVEIKTGKHNLIVIDNLMSILSIQKYSDKNEAQGDFMQRCCDLAKNEATHIILVLHPNKTVGKGQGMEFEQISGTLDLSNKADNIISVRRETEEELNRQGFNGEIAILKNRYFPDLIKIKTHYEKETGLLLEIDQQTGQYLAYNFKWQKHLKGAKQNDDNVPDWVKEAMD